MDRLIGELSLGIDLGTTYSAAATARDDRVEIFQLGERAATIPSIVVLRADGEVLTGDAAERRSLGEPTRTAREFKRRLGDPTPIILGGTPYGAEAPLAHLLRAIVGRVSEQSGGPPAAIVVTHPASYGAYKIDLLEQAIRQADIEHVSLLTEPEAAAVYYAQQERVPVGAVIAVYDFGGGTFDATILRKTEGGFEQLGRPEGMERLGGIDFDEALFRRVMTMVGATGAVVDANDPTTLAAIARLREECRRAKEALSSDTDATVAVVLPGLQTEMRLTRGEFEDMIRPRITETIGALGRAVKSAGLEFGGIDRILLVGGSSRIPLAAEMVRDATGRPVAVDAHPKHSMALGAALIAEERRRAALAGAGAATGAAVVAANDNGESWSPAVPKAAPSYSAMPDPAPPPPPGMSRPRASAPIGRGGFVVGVLGGVADGVAGGAQRVASAARGLRDRLGQVAVSQDSGLAKPIVNTGLSTSDRPDAPLDPNDTLAVQGEYVFWMEIAPPIAGSIEERPVGAPEALVAAEALLDVVLFDVSGPQVVIDGSDKGGVRLRADGSAVVVRQPSDRPWRGVAADMLARRLLFPLRSPAGPGAMRFRCNLYYAGVLIQSRLVSCDVRPTATPSPGALRSRLDYLLARSLVPERLAGTQPHELSVLVNENHDGTHGFYFASGKGDWRRRATFDADALQTYLDQARGALRLAAWGDGEPWHGQPYRYHGAPDSERLMKDLIPICTRGYAFYSELIDRLAGLDASGESKAEELTTLMRTPGSVQIALLGSPRSVLPAALIYDYDLEGGRTLTDYSICDQFLADLDKKDGLHKSVCFAGACPNRVGHTTVICPSGLWGYRHSIGLPVSLSAQEEWSTDGSGPADEPDLGEDPPGEIRLEGALQLAVGVSTDPDLTEWPRHEIVLHALKPDLGWHFADTRTATFDMLLTTSPHIVYFYCHGGVANQRPFIQVGPKNDEAIYSSDLRARHVHWKAPRPLVFINGCHTTALEPREAHELVSGFVTIARASGVIGTEITIFEPLARGFAEAFLRAFVGGSTVGEAVRLARIDLLQQANPLGLAYTAYALSNLRLAGLPKPI